MSPEQIELVKSSYVLVEPISDQAADLFYGRLFEVAPEVRSLFPDDMADQKKKLFTMLGVAVKGLDRIDALLPALHALGKRHIGYGTRPDHYAVVGGALLWTLSQGLGEAFTPDVEQAWAQAYSLLSQAMLAGAEETA
jgi:nitric oxide dioxygenase